MKLWTIFLAACLAAANGYCDELTPAKRDDIRALIKETGAVAMGAQMVDAMVPLVTMQLSTAYPEIPKSTLDKIGSRISALMERKMTEPGGMMDRLTPVYAKHLSHDDIKQLLAFYRTDVGKKIINRMPVVTSESMAVGQQWGASLAPDFQSIVVRTLSEDKVVLKQK
jgi:hypothetical protein